MKLFSKFKSLFVPREEEKSRRKTTKKIKKKTIRTKKKPKKKTKVKVKKKILKKGKKSKKKKILKKRKKVIKKRVKKKVKKKVVKKKINSKVKKKPSKKRQPLKERLRQPTKIKKKSAAALKTLFKEEEIGTITHYFGKISVGIIKLRSTLRIGERIHIKGAHDNFTQTIKSMQINHADVSMAGKGDEIGIKVPAPIHENDRVYRA